jgi:DNA-binding HxlR family transcriptional regulator
MKSKSFAGMRCSIAGAMEQIGDRWAMLVLRDLAFGVRRYDELRASSGIPTTTLATRLKHLETHGLIEKRAYQAHPPRFDYRLTAKGRDLATVLTALREWGDRWDATGYGAPSVELVDDASGHPLRLAFVDAETGQPVPRRRARLRAGPGADDLIRSLVDRLNSGDAA